MRDLALLIGIRDGKFVAAWFGIMFVGGCALGFVAACVAGLI